MNKLFSLIWNWLGFNQAEVDYLKQMPEYKKLQNYITALNFTQSDLRDKIDDIKATITSSSPFSIFKTKATEELSRMKELDTKINQDLNTATQLTNEVENARHGSTETLTNDIKTFTGGINEKFQEQT